MTGRPLPRHPRPAVVVVVAAAVLVAVTTLAYAEYYKLTGVRRVEQDLYKTLDGVYIETRYCYHYAFGEDAVLKWEFEGSYENKVIWDDDSTCDVKSAWTK